MKKRGYTGLAIGLLAMLVSPVAAQVPAESLAAWTNTLRTESLARRMEVVSKLVHLDPGALQADTRDAAVAELTRFNRAFFEGHLIEGGEGLDGEALGEYTIQLTSLVAGFRTPEADRALILGVAVSGGVQRRVARLGDEAIPTLARMIERGYEAGAALETLGLAWFLADSTAAALSHESRQMVVRQFLGASGNADLWIGLAAALADARDPAFLPLARVVERRAREAREIGGAYLQLTTIPSLEAALTRLTPVQALGRTRRSLEAFCADAASGARRGACEALRHELDAAVGHLEAERRGPARNLLEAVARRADAALASGALTTEEHTLVADGALQVIRLL